MTSARLTRAQQRLPAQSNAAGWLVGSAEPEGLGVARGQEPVTQPPARASSGSGGHLARQSRSCRVIRHSAATLKLSVPPPRAPHQFTLTFHTACPADNKPLRNNNLSPTILPSASEFHRSDHLHHRHLSEVIIPPTSVCSLVVWLGSSTQVHQRHPASQ
ncbi:hypothetical protein ACJJTC_000280 [Scirpophaga incertulas]